MKSLLQEWQLIVRLLIIGPIVVTAARSLVRSRRSRWKTALLLLYGFGVLGYAVVLGMDRPFRFEATDILLLAITHTAWSDAVWRFEFTLILGYAMVLGPVLAFLFQPTGRPAELAQELRHTFASADAARSFLRWFRWLALGFLVYFVFVWLPYRLANH
jgi:hypothetical protein